MRTIPRQWLQKLPALGLLGLLGWGGYSLLASPPMHAVTRGDVALRVNQLTGTVSEWRDGSVWVLPGLHQLRSYSLRDQIYRPAQGQHDSPFQSIEGLALGVDLSVRYALDASRIAELSGSLPDDWGGEIVEPAIQGVIFKIFPRYTVREIFSTKRSEILAAIEAELQPRLAADGMLLRSVNIGKIELPAEYRAGMENLLAEELASDKMRFTLELKEKSVTAAALEAQAAKVRSEINAEAQGNAQIIEARAQEQAMAHILPFKQRQIEQRKLEAEAEKTARIKTAEGNAAARVIEAAAEAESRQKLADAEWYRQERLGKLSSEQMERDGALVTRFPLLIQKTMADKLSDKINVIIAAPPADGSFIGNALLGGSSAAGNARSPAHDNADSEE